ncbi:MAG: hypothetical protein VX641_02755 [Planctomycetota bacterium]|nr:hypothetical protein [Planctomycetota bacterium]
MTALIAGLTLLLVAIGSHGPGHPSPPTTDPAPIRFSGPDWSEVLERLEEDHFGPRATEDTRREGIRTLRSIVAPEAFLPMIERFHDQRDDVRDAMLDHLAEQLEPGQAALAWLAIHARDERLRDRSTQRLKKPPGHLVLDLLDSSLRHPNMHIATHAAHLVNVLEVTEAIPLLINTQITASEVNRRGIPNGTGMIRSGRQISYIAGVRPVFGPGVAAYQPIVGTINEGFAVESGTGRRLICRPGIHQALVDITSREIGSSTESFGYDVAQWHEWHQSTYLPFKEDQRRQVERQESIKRRAAEIERSRSRQGSGT